MLANDVGEGLSLKSVNESSTKWGRVVINGDKLVYTPRYNYTGSDEFWYVFEDAWGRGTGSAGLHRADDKYFWYSTDPSINGGIEQVTVGSTFRPADDAVAIDKHTNLVWQRCPLGQVWNKTTSQCDFSVMAKNWKDTLESAPEGWRLPNLKELASLAEYRCSGPALNITVFPNLGNWNYWTSTVMKRLDLSGPTFNSPGGTITNDFSNRA